MYIYILQNQFDINMNQSFDLLRTQIQESMKLRSCIEMLIKIFRNILQNPSKSAYR